MKVEFCPVPPNIKINIKELRIEIEEVIEKFIIKQRAKNEPIKDTFTTVLCVIGSLTERCIKSAVFDSEGDKEGFIDNYIHLIKKSIMDDEENK
jgi:hypothetical protein